MGTEKEKSAINSLHKIIIKNDTKMLLCPRDIMIDIDR